jgi:hypothetical protein
VDTSQILLSVLWGAIGMGYFVYGKKQQRFLSMLSGIALMAFPYFVENWLASVAIGLVLTALPLVVR